MSQIVTAIDSTRATSYPLLPFDPSLLTSSATETGSNGANLSFPFAFGIPDSEFLEDGSVNPDAEKNLWLVGLINSAPYIASAFLGCWLSDPLNTYFGRRGAIFISAIFLILTPIGSAVSQTWQELFVCRLLMGIGMGLKGSTTPIFALVVPEQLHEFVLTSILLEPRIRLPPFEGRLS